MADPTDLAAFAARKAAAIRADEELEAARLTLERWFNEAAPGRERTFVRATCHPPDGGPPVSVLRLVEAAREDIDEALPSAAAEAAEALAHAVYRFRLDAPPSSRPKLSLVPSE
jgi:hypothetical protein